MSPEELAELQLGQLISGIGKITYDNAMSLYEASKLYELIKPTLDPMQCDAWEITLNLMEMEGVA